MIAYNVKRVKLGLKAIMMVCLKAPAKYNPSPGVSSNSQPDLFQKHNCWNIVVD